MNKETIEILQKLNAQDEKLLIMLETQVKLTDAKIDILNNKIITLESKMFITRLLAALVTFVALGQLVAIIKLSL